MTAPPLTVRDLVDAGEWAYDLLADIPVSDLGEALLTAWITANTPPALGLISPLLRADEAAHPTAPRPDGDLRDGPAQPSAAEAAPETPADPAPPTPHTGAAAPEDRPVAGRRQARRTPARIALAALDRGLAAIGLVRSSLAAETCTPARSGGPARTGSDTSPLASPSVGLDDRSVGSSDADVDRNGGAQ